MATVSISGLECGNTHGQHGSPLLFTCMVCVCVISSCHLCQVDNTIIVVKVVYSSEEPLSLASRYLIQYIRSFCGESAYAME